MKDILAYTAFLEPRVIPSNDGKINHDLMIYEAGKQDVYNFIRNKLSKELLLEIEINELIGAGDSHGNR